MKTLYKLSLLTLLIGSGACKKSQDFLRDNTTPTGVGYVPVSNNTLQDVTASPIKNLATSSTSPTLYVVGASFKTELTFFSQSPIQGTWLFNTIGSGARTLVDSFPYAPAFSAAKHLDTLLVPYTAPAAAANTVIRLDYEIRNKDMLSTVRTAYIKVQ